MTAKTAKIAVYGAGAMGTVLGAFLTLGGLEVDLITRNAAHVKGLNEHGAIVVCEGDGIEKCISARAFTPDELFASGKIYDVIFLMTKQRFNEEVLTSLLPHLAKDGVVCTTQNGLPEASVATVVGNERTYGAATSFGATFIGEGKVALTSQMQAMSMELGGYQNNGAKHTLLTEILSYAGRAIGKADFVRSTDDLRGARWSKLTINAAFSGLSVVTGGTFGEIARKRKSRKIALGILRECMSVATMDGVNLAPMQGHDMQKLLGGRTPLKRLFAYMVLPFAMKRHKRLRSGMLKDVENGRRCEIDFVTGLVCKEGKRLGVETPLCDKVIELVHGIEDGLYEIGFANLDFFE